MPLQILHAHLDAQQDELQAQYAYENNDAYETDIRNATQHDINAFI